MRKLLFIAWVMVCAVTLAMTSCRDKKTQDKVNNRVENVKNLQTGHLIEPLISWKQERIV